MKNQLTILLGIMMAFALLSCEKLEYDGPGNLVPKTVEEDPTIPQITVNGVKLHSEAFGHPDSTMIVCVHGGPGSDYRYMLNCKDLADYGYRVVFYDQRGSGLSQRLPESAYTSSGSSSLNSIYDELSGVIAHYRTSPGQKVILLGHSWGAMLATAYTGKYPNSIQGLTIQEPGGLKWEDVMEYMTSTRTFSFWSEYLNDVTFLDQIITGKQDEHEKLDYKFALLGSTRNTNTEGSVTEPGNFWRLGAVINTGLLKVGMREEPDFSEGIGNFHIPVLFFYSEYNTTYTDSWARKMTSVFNEVEICKVPGTGHDGIIMDDRAWKNTTMPRMLNYFNSL